MAKSLGERLDQIEAAIDAIESGAQSYELHGRKLERGDLGSLYAQEERLYKKIAMHGRDYIPGQNTRPLKMEAHVIFH